MSQVREVTTSIGTARLHVHGRGRRVLALGHGAGGGVDAPDLRAACGAALALGWRVVVVEQPWRVQGRKVAEAPPRLDRAWVEALSPLRRDVLVVGGRSAGARVACRTAAALSADGVLCLAFPLHPPGRPEVSREPELSAVDVPLLVVQGDADAFGVPAGAHLVPGADHGFRVRRGLPPAGPQVAEAVTAWLQALT